MLVSEPLQGFDQNCKTCGRTDFKDGEICNANEKSRIILN